MTETTTQLAEATTHTLDVPGAELTYDIVRNEASAAPVLMLIGSPMGAAGFGTLAKHFSDRSIVTYDPRGSERSTKAGPDESSQRRSSTPTTSIASSGRSVARSISLRAVAARSTPLRSSRRIPRTCASSSHTSRRSPRSCPTRRTRRRPSARSVTRTSRRAGAPGWRTSSRSSPTRASSPTTSANSRGPTRRCSACRRRMTATAPT